MVGQHFSSFAVVQLFFTTVAYVDESDAATASTGSKDESKGRS